MKMQSVLQPTKKGWMHSLPHGLVLDPASAPALALCLVCRSQSYALYLSVSLSLSLLPLVLFHHMHRFVVRRAGQFYKYRDQP